MFFSGAPFRLIPTFKKFRTCLPLILGLAFLLLSPPSAHTQEEVLRWFGPDLGKMKNSVNYQFTAYSKEEVSRQGQDFKMNQQRGSLLLPIRQDSQSNWSFSLNAHGQGIKTKAVLPDTREAFPQDLWDLRLGTQVRHRFENGWTGGGSVAIGSASDRPFASDDELLVHATVFTRIPDGERNAWLLMVNYSKTREFLPNVPLPAAGYWYEPSDQYRLVIGIPFAFLEARPIPDFSFSLAYFPITTVLARASYRPYRGFQVYGGFEWGNESYVRYDRREEKDRLTYNQKRALVGFRAFPLKWLSLDFSAGYAFDRFYYEGQGYSDRHQNRLDISNGYFGSIRAGVQF